MSTSKNVSVHKKVAGIKTEPILLFAKLSEIVCFCHLVAQAVIF